MLDFKGRKYKSCSKGYGVTGLDLGSTVPNGTGGCTLAGGCNSIRGHISLLPADLSAITWTKIFNDWTGGTGAYAGLTPLSGRACNFFEFSESKQRFRFRKSIVKAELEKLFPRFPILAQVANFCKNGDPEN